MTTQPEPTNVLVLMADEHARNMAGCYGHPVVRTPNIDRLADEGTRFDAAYAPSPICVPSRASFATGRYVHELGLWDNSRPYTGREAPGWGALLGRAGRRVGTVGKLHWTSETLDRGFPDQRLPMYVVEGVHYGFLRAQMPIWHGGRNHVEQAGPGETEYTRYDRAVADEAVRWIRDATAEGEPWVLYVSFVTPHFPLIAPPEQFELYSADEVVLPSQWHQDDWPMHPAIAENRRLQALDMPFPESTVRRAIQAYYGLVSFMDAQVGRVIDALDETGLRDRTRLIYTSDHGETLGAHGLWWKSNMFEEAVGIPLIVAGPAIPRGGVVATPASLVDVAPTLVRWTGTEVEDPPVEMSGVAFDRLIAGEASDRSVLSEYHDAFSVGAEFALRRGTDKYIHRVGFDAQLFDLAGDPKETTDLAAAPESGPLLRELDDELRRLVDPEEVDRRARADQGRRAVEARSAGRIPKIHRHNYTPAPSLPAR